MKTRIIYSDIWDDDTFQGLNADTKTLYLYLLTNPFVGQSRIYKCSNRTLIAYLGFTNVQIEKCKNDLEIVSVAYFKDGWVMLSSNVGYVHSFYGGEKNEKARAVENSRIPSTVLGYFDTIFHTNPILTPYKVDIPLNLNHKSKRKPKEIFKELDNGDVVFK